jgi:tetratricopeptide (TPR) repeat protein
MAWNNKGVVLAKLGNYNEALNAFDKAIEIDPKSSLAWKNKRFLSK